MAFISNHHTLSLVQAFIGQRTMESQPFEYIEISDPVHLETRTECAEEDYILVKAKSAENVPIKDWHPPAYCFTNR